jgi:bacterioferritin-associated ferredoxin
VVEGKIRSLVKYKGCESINEVQQYIDICDTCTTCQYAIKDIIEEENEVGLNCIQNAITEMEEELREGSSLLYYNKYMNDKVKEYE